MERRWLVNAKVKGIVLALLTAVAGRAGFGLSAGQEASTAPSVSASTQSQGTSARLGSGTPRLVFYLPDYKGVSFTEYVKGMDFTKITHLNLAFGDPPKCDGVCTATSDMRFGMKGQTDADVDAVVAAAHAAGVKVLLSIGGGGGDQQIIQFYNVGLTAPLIASLAKYVEAHKLDGVDVDIEDPSAMGAPFATFVDAAVAQFRPGGKLVTAAVAKYMQDSMPDRALHAFDFINVMNYSATGAEAQLKWYAENKKVPKDQIVLGVPFFGSDLTDTKEEDYRTLLAAYPNAWRVDSVGGGLLDDGRTFRYVGEATMATETKLGRSYGGVMVWELMGDAPKPHSLRDIVLANF